jgi:hypothetical protein
MEYNWMPVSSPFLAAAAKTSDLNKDRPAAASALLRINALLDWYIWLFFCLL